MMDMKISKLLQASLISIALLSGCATSSKFPAYEPPTSIPPEVLAKNYLTILETYQKLEIPAKEQFEKTEEYQARIQSNLPKGPLNTLLEIPIKVDPKVFSYNADDEKVEIRIGTYECFAASCSHTYQFEILDNSTTYPDKNFSTSYFFWSWPNQLYFSFPLDIEAAKRQYDPSNYGMLLVAVITDYFDYGDHLDYFISIHSKNWQLLDLVIYDKKSLEVLGSIRKHYSL